MRIFGKKKIKFVTLSPDLDFKKIATSNKN